MRFLILKIVIFNICFFTSEAAVANANPLKISHGLFETNALDDAVDRNFCLNSNEFKQVVSFIHHQIGQESWQVVASSLSQSNREVENKTLLRLQRARNFVAKCIKTLFDAEPTGSARDLSKISQDNALIDIDMSVEPSRIDDAKSWLSGLFPEPEKTLSLSLLIDPITLLACKTTHQHSRLNCVYDNTVAAAKLSLFRHNKFQPQAVYGLTHIASLKVADRICPTSYIFPDNAHVFLALTNHDHEKRQRFIGKYPDVTQTSPGFQSTANYELLVPGINDSAYYWQAGSIRRWVIEREPIFQDKLDGQFNSYAFDVQVKAIETEGAVFEQWLFAENHKDSFYYQRKYLFRALDQIGFSITGSTPEIAYIFNSLASSRPSSSQDAYREFMRRNSEKGQEKEPYLNKLNHISYDEFVTIVEQAEIVHINAILEYFKARRSENYSIWNEICVK